MKTKEKQVFVDPITGDKTTQITKTKVERKDSSSSSSSSNGGRKIRKEKHAYKTNVRNTPDGVQTTMVEKHRKGGIVDNLKNKIHNMMHWSWLTSLYF